MEEKATQTEVVTEAKLEVYNHKKQTPQSLIGKRSMPHRSDSQQKLGRADSVGDNSSIFDFDKIINK